MADGEPIVRRSEHLGLRGFEAAARSPGDEDVDDARVHRPPKILVGMAVAGHDHVQPMVANERLDDAPHRLIAVISRPRT